MAKTQTQQGLKVTVEIIDKVYQTGRKVAQDFKEKMTILFDNDLAKWNYTVIPELANTEVI